MGGGGVEGGEGVGGGERGEGPPWAIQNNTLKCCLSRTTS